MTDREMYNESHYRPSQTPRQRDVNKANRIQLEKEEVVKLVGQLRKIGKFMGNSLHEISKKVGYIFASHQNKAINDQYITNFKLMEKERDEYKQLVMISVSRRFFIDDHACHTVKYSDGYGTKSVFGGVFSGAKPT